MYGYIPVNGEIIGIYVQSLYSKQRIDLYLEWKVHSKK